MMLYADEYVTGLPLLFEDLRVDEEQFALFDPQVIEAMLQCGYKVKLLRALLRLLKSMNTGSLMV